MASNTAKVSRPHLIVMLVIIVFMALAQCDEKELGDTSEAAATTFAKERVEIEVISPDLETPAQLPSLDYEEYINAGASILDDREVEDGAWVSPEDEARAILIALGEIEPEVVMDDRYIVDPETGEVYDRKSPKPIPKHLWHLLPEALR